MTRKMDYTIGWGCGWTRLKLLFAPGMGGLDMIRIGPALIPVVTFVPCLGLRPSVLVAPIVDLCKSTVTVNVE